MSIFITGATGYLGSYVTHNLLRDTDQRLSVLVRAKDRAEAEQKLWRGLQLHLSPTRFWDALKRIDFVHGDLHAPKLGIEDEARQRLVRSTDSVLHIAASLNRKSEKACLNTNLRGTLSVINLAREIADLGTLRKFSHVSTVAVAGQRSHEVVLEDEAIDWGRSDYDPYARTKKFAEHMVRELLPDVRLNFFRPSIVMGDSTRPETSQFDMVRAFCLLADLPVVPMAPTCRLDVVSADYVGSAIARLHAKAKTDHSIYHLSSGRHAKTAAEISNAVNDALGRRRARFVSKLETPFARAIDGAHALPGRNAVTHAAALMKVFWPYITFDTVFDNERVVSELGRRPLAFTDYAAPLYQYSKRVNFQFPYRDLSPRPTVITPFQEIHA